MKLGYRFHGILARFQGNRVVEESRSTIAETKIRLIGETCLSRNLRTRNLRFPLPFLANKPNEQFYFAGDLFRPRRKNRETVGPLFRVKKKEKYNNEMVNGGHDSVRID